MSLDADADDRQHAPAAVSGWRSRGVACAPDTLVVAIAWIAAIIVPIGASAYWPIAAAHRVLHDHALRFSTDAISPLPLDGSHWVAQPWLPALAFDGMWRAMGVAGLGLLGALVAAATTTLALRLARRIAPPLAAAVAGVFAVALLFPETLRTEAIAVLLGLVVITLAGSRLAAAVPLVLVVWANSHGSVPIGFGLAACAALGVLDVGGQLGRAQGAVATWRVRWRVAWLAMCALAMLCTPLGFGLFAYIHDVSSTPVLTSITPIWRPLELTSWRAYLGAVALLVALAGAWPAWRAATARIRAASSTGGQRLRVFWYAFGPLAPPLGFAVLTVRAERNVAWLAVLLVVPVARGLARFWVARSWSPQLRSGLIATSLVAVSVLGVLALAPGTHAQHTFARNGGPPLKDLAHFGPNDRIYASIEWADEIHVRTGAKVALDARLERYREADLRAYLRSTGHGDLRGTGLSPKSGCGSKWNVLELRTEKARPLVRAVLRNARSAFSLAHQKGDLSAPMARSASERLSAKARSRAFQVRCEFRLVSVLAPGSSKAPTNRATATW